MHGAARVVKVLKSHPQDVYWQGLRQFTAMLGIQLKGVFRQMVEIQNVWLNRNAFAEILGIRLQHTIGGAVAGDAKQCEQCDAAN